MFSEAHFWQFCSQLVISSKDEGEIRFDRPLGTQRYLIRQIYKGLNEGIHTFVTCKGRQQGASTILLALDLYWMFKYRGIRGTIVTQDEPTREDFREKLKEYYMSLPKGWRQRATVHNRVQFLFKNKSGFIYQIASKKAGNKLGRGKGITYAHLTELGSWDNNSDALASLQASFSDIHPARLYIYESTANGPDIFQDIWETAEKAVTQRAIFIPWWMKETYQCSPDSKIESDKAVFATYWGKPCDPDKVIKKLETHEVEMYKAVQRTYGVNLTAEQMAWYRWQFVEKFSEDWDMLCQEHPSVAEVAFRLTGSQFFQSSDLNALMQVAKGRKFIPYNMSFGATFEDTKIRPCEPHHANLKIFIPAIEEALKRKAYYTLGADPAFGSSEWKDASVIHIDRVYGDYIEQAAEFHDASCTTEQFAWAVATLAGWYENTTINLELSGPGQVVYQQLEKLLKTAQAIPTKENKALMLIMQNVRNYVYHKYNGNPNKNTGNKHWQTTPQTKERMMTMYKDSVVRGVVDVASIELIAEMKKIVRDEGRIEASGRGKDDRVIAAALSHITWMDNLQLRLKQWQFTKDRAEAAEKVGAGKNQQSQEVLKHVLAGYFDSKRIVH